MALTSQNKLLIFTIDDELYAVSVEQVLEVMNMPEITPVPNSKEFVLGFITLRGNVLTVIDLEKRFGLKRDKQANKDSKVIIIDSNGSKFGIVVDSVSEVVTVNPEDIKPAPETIKAGLESVRVLGVFLKDIKSEALEEKISSLSGADENVPVMVLDLSTIFQDIKNTEGGVQS